MLALDRQVLRLPGSSLVQGHAMLVTAAGRLPLCKVRGGMLRVVVGTAVRAHVLEVLIGFHNYRFGSLVRK